MEKCPVCEKPHGFADCPLKEDAKALVIARLENMPANIRVSIG